MHSDVISVLSQRILNLQESATIRMAQLSRELKSKGIDIIDLSLGEPDFDTPSHIKEAAKKAIDDNFSHYTPVAGYAELRKAIADKLLRDNGLHYSPEQIVVSTGAKQSIANAVLCIVNPGDEVLLPAPYWVTYAAITQLAEGIPVELPTTIDTHFKISPEQLEQAITPRTRLIIYSSPCNPTGTVYSQDELAALAEVLERHPQVYILSDEIYEYINYTGKPHASIASITSLRERVVLVNGFSKGYAMTGWRLGYIAAPKTIAKACDKIQGQFTSATCSIAQKAAEAAASGPLEPSLEMVKAFRKRRDLVYDYLKNISGLKLNLPDGAFYFFPDVSGLFGSEYNGHTIQTPEDVSMFLLQEARVATVSGEAFGDKNCIRLSYAASEEKLTEACRRIVEAIFKLN
ncbi:MAG: pyridoxal phosphate-dependent aminotransferase [Chitinophagales bacterium]|nr:pyridoxal phosphate-dependent aminotransferase [Chitinophagales bacterium]